MGWIWSSTAAFLLSSRKFGQFQRMPPECVRRCHAKQNWRKRNKLHLNAWGRCCLELQEHVAQRTASKQKAERLIRPQTCLKKVLGHCNPLLKSTWSFVWKKCSRPPEKQVLIHASLVSGGNPIVLDGFTTYQIPCIFHPSLRYNTSKPQLVRDDGTIFPVTNKANQLGRILQTPHPPQKKCQAFPAKIGGLFPNHLGTMTSLRQD